MTQRRRKPPACPAIIPIPPIIDTASRQQVFLSATALSHHDLPAAIAGFSFSSGNVQKNLNRITEHLGLAEQQAVTVLSGRQMSLRDMALALAVIQFYGLLKTIGISPGQLKRLICYRMGRVLLLALPGGLLLGCAMTQWIVPLLLGDLLEGFMQADFHWAIPVIPALFSCAMIFAIFAMTARKVLSISPIAALRYTEEGIKRKTSRSTG